MICQGGMPFVPPFRHEILFHSGIDLHLNCGRCARFVSCLERSEVSRWACLWLPSAWIGQLVPSTGVRKLDVAGVRAQFKGSGTINGMGNYGFLLTAVDEQVAGGLGLDRFRVTIWNSRLTRLCTTIRSTRATTRR